MARIADAELEQLKREVSLQRLVEAKGVTLQKRGDSLVGKCPFHDDGTPSLNVSVSKNLFRCFGCNASGSVIDWVMKAEGVSFRHAVELLRNGVQLSPAVVKKATVPKLPSPIHADADDATLLNEVVDYYHQQLLTSPEARAYLKSRGLDDEQLIRHFKLGFANRTLGLRLPHNNRVAGAELRGRLQKLGVLRETGHEHFAGSVVVPLFDEAGAVQGMYGRKVTPNLRPGTPLHLYLKGPHRVAFNSAALANHQSAIVCEAVLDALSFWAAGFRNVTCAYGVDGFTAHHLEALKRQGVKNVWLAFDRDEPGDAGAEQLAKQLQAENIDCWRVLFPRGMDANEYAVKVQPAAKSLAVALRQAQFMGPDSKARPAPQLSSQPPAAGGEQAQKRGWVEEHLAAKKAEAAAVEPGAAVAAPAPMAPSVEAERVEISSPAAETPPSNSATSSEPSTATNDDEQVFNFGPRRYRVRGLLKPQGSDALRLNVLASSNDLFHVDTFDLYQAKARTHFVSLASVELQLEPEVVKRDVAQLLLQLEALLEKRAAEKAGPKTPTLTEGQRDEALALLKEPKLLERVVADFGRCGMVGEENNALVGYLAAVSRKLDEPLAVLIQSSSAAGKSSLMEAVLAFVPEEEKVKYSAMTGQSLFYMGDADLKHKVLAVVEEEGASKASYALKLLQSEGELTIASTGKNPHTGKLETHEYRVEGPTQLFLTTTASELDEELLNRCLVLTVDEEQQQTRAIHQLQRHKRTLEGLLQKKQRESVLAVHRNAQRLLRPLAVVNPYALQLTFPDGRTRARRDFPKYLTLISSIALLHQYQRPVKTASHAGGVVEYVEVTLEDVAIANQLAAAVLGRSVDELPPQTRRLLTQVQTLAAKRASEEKVTVESVRFTRRQLREALGWRNSQLALHLEHLVDFEFLAVQRAARGALVYGLNAEVDAAPPTLRGLAEVKALAHGYDGSASGVSSQLPVTLRPASKAGGARPTAEGATAFGLQTPASGVSARALPAHKNGHVTDKGLP